MQASCPKPGTTQTKDFHFSHPKAVSHVCLVLEATVSHVCLNETRFHVVKSQTIDDLKSVCWFPVGQSGQVKWFSGQKHLPPILRNRVPCLEGPIIERESRFLKVVLWSPYTPCGTHTVGVGGKEMQKKSKGGRCHLLCSFLEPTAPIHRSVLTLSQSPQCLKHTPRVLSRAQSSPPILDFLPKHRLSGKSCNRRLKWLSLLPEVTVQVRVGCLSPADQYTQLWTAMFKGLGCYIFSLGNSLLGGLLSIRELITYRNRFFFSSQGLLKITYRIQYIKDVSSDDPIDLGGQAALFLLTFQLLSLPVNSRKRHKGLKLVILFVKFDLTCGLPQRQCQERNLFP